MSGKRVRLLTRVLVIFSTTFLILFQATSLPVYSISKEQKRLYTSGILYYDADQCGEVSKSSDSTIDGNTQALAQEMLENNNISYWTNIGVNTRDVVVALSEGKKAFTTSPEAQQKEVDINPSILRFILEAAGEGRVMVNALTDKDHSSTSNHYKGLAVDLDNNPTNTSVPVDRLIAIANKYKGVKNNESTHHHFDFTKMPPKDESSSQNKSVYMVGDSITVGAKSFLEKEFTAENLNLYVNASTSRSISGAGIDGDRTSGLQAIDNDHRRVKQAGKIVVSLGTNPENNFSAKVEDMVNAIKKHNTTADIYWVNIFPTRSDLDREGINQTLERYGSRGFFRVIDTLNKDIQLSSDQVHPTGEGSKRFAKVVALGIEGEAPPSSDTVAQCSCSTGGVALTGSNNEEKVWNYFTGKGLKPFQVAGIMGNMQQESGFDPQNIQDPGGRTKDPSSVTAGWGLIQWTPGNKILGIAKEAKINGPIYELATQLDIVWWHMNNISPTGVQNMLEGFKKTTSWKEAADEFEDKVEGAGTPMMEARYSFAQEVLAKYGSGASGGESGSSACATGEAGQVVGEYSLPLPKRIYDENKDLFMKPHHDYPAADISVPEGTPVFSMTSGTIVSTTNDDGCGLGVIIKASSGAEYTYCHGSSLGAVRTGEVKAGQRIMTSGNTGRSFGPHLHVQIRVGEELRCPQKLFESIADGKPIKEEDLPSSGCISGSL